MTATVSQASNASPPHLADMSVSFQPFVREQGLYVEGTELGGENPDNIFHFVKTVYGPNGKPYSFVVELKGQDRIDDAQALYKELKLRQGEKDNEVVSIELRFLTVTLADGTVKDLEAKDPAVVRLRELFGKADYVKGIPQRWPELHEHSHGDLGGNPSLQIPAGRLQEMSNWKAEDFCEHLRDNPRLTNERKRRIENAHKLLEEAPKEIEKMIDKLQEEQLKEQQNAEKSLALLHEINRLRTFHVQIMNIDRFAVFSAILLLEPGAKRTPQSIEQDVQFLMEIVESQDQPLKDGYLAKVMRSRLPVDTYAEKQYLYDIVLLLGSKARREYVTLSRLSGQPVKKPALAEAIVAAIRHNMDCEGSTRAVNKLCHHPMMQDGLKGQRHNEFVQFVTTLFSSWNKEAEESSASASEASASSDDEK